MENQTLENRTREKNVHCDGKFVERVENFVKTSEAEEDHNKNELNKLCRKVEFYVQEGCSIKNAMKKAELYKNFWHRFNLINEKYLRKIEYYRGLEIPIKVARVRAEPYKMYWEKINRKII